MRRAPYTQAAIRPPYGGPYCINLRRAHLPGPTPRHVCPVDTLTGSRAAFSGAKVPAYPPHRRGDLAGFPVLWYHGNHEKIPAGPSPAVLTAWPVRAVILE